MRPHLLSHTGNPRLLPGLHRRMNGWLAGLIFGSVCLSLITVPTLAPFASAPGVTGLTTMSAPACNSYGSAFRIFSTNAAGTLTSGATVTVEYQLEAVNYVPSDGAVNLSMPGVFAKFPLATGGNLTLFFLARQIPLPDQGWSSTSYATDVHKITGTTTFSAHKASLTTELLAVQSTAPYGLNLSVEWRWIVASPTGPNVTGSWTELYNGLSPVQKVTVTPTLPSGSSQYLGTLWTATLTGAVANQPFLVEVENASVGLPTGHMQGSFTGSSNATSLQVSTYLFYSRPNLTLPGLLLVHIHERCEGLLSNTLVHATYVSSAQIHLLSSLAACSSLDFNGTVYPNGTHVSVAPSPTFYPLDAGACPGHRFEGWAITGFLDVSNVTDANTSVAITNQGGVTAHWK